VADGRNEVVRVWAILTNEEKEDVLNLDSEDLSLLRQSEKIISNAEVSTAIRYCWAQMLENSDAPFPENIEPEIVLYVFTIFDEKLIRAYVEHSSRVKVKVAVILGAWIFVQTWWVRYAIVVTLSWLGTLEITDNWFTRNALRPFRDSSHTLYESRLLSFICALFCIELGYWLPWLFTLKVVSLLPVILVVLETYLSGLSSIRAVLMVPAQLCLVYLSWYSTPLFIIFTAWLLPWMTTKILVIFLLGLTISIQIFCTCFPFNVLDSPQIKDILLSLITASIFILPLVFLLARQYCMFIVIGTIVFATLRFLEVILVFLHNSAAMAAKILKRRSVDMIMISHLCLLIWRFLTTMIMKVCIAS